MTKSISETMQKLLEKASKAKFYRGNIDLFLKYFDSQEQYEALILAANFDKMENIIKNGAAKPFGFERFLIEN